MSSPKKIALVRGVTGIFFWGGKVIFPDVFPGVKCFFPVENSHFGRPKTNFRRFQKWKAKKKKKKKKKKVLTSFSDVFLLPFPIFHLFYSIFTPFPFFLASFFPIRQQKFPGQKSLGGHSAPPPPPACYATGLGPVIQIVHKYLISQNFGNILFHFPTIQNINIKHIWNHAETHRFSPQMRLIAYPDHKTTLIAVGLFLIQLIILLEFSTKNKQTNKNIVLNQTVV